VAVVMYCNLRVTTNVVPLLLCCNYKAHDASAYTFNNSSGHISAIGEHLPVFLAKLIL